jgi:hypothetical protein
MLPLPFVANVVIDIFRKLAASVSTITANLRKNVTTIVHWCQMAEFRAAGPKNGTVKFLAA